MIQVLRNRTQSIFFLLLLCFSSLFSSSQVLTPRYISTSANSGGFYEYLPQGYETGSDTYPVLIFLHGIGEEGNGTSAQLSKILNTGLPALINKGGFPTSFVVNSQTFKFIVIMPQFAQWPSLTDVDAIVNYTTTHYRVNTKRLYITGLSMGGGPTWEYTATTTYIGKVAGIVPIAGASYPAAGRINILADANMPVWATVNSADPTGIAPYTEDYIAGILARNPKAPAKISVFNSTSHDAWTHTYDPNFRENGLNIYEWLLQYQKGTTPPPVNKAPVDNAGTDATITLPTNSYQIKATASDPDGTIAKYAWTKTAGPTAYTISNAAILNPIISGLTAGTYTFRLTVTDNSGATAFDDINIVVNSAPAGNQVPVANAGADAAITLPTSSYQIAATASDPDGTIAKYAWTKTAGPTAYTISNAAVLNPVISGLTAGTYTFRLTVTDNAGATAFDDINIVVNSAPVGNKAPVVNAGPDVSITYPVTSYACKATASDPDGKIATYAWTKTAGPTSYGFSNASIINPVIGGLTPGTYTFRLTVTDNSGATSFDEFNIVANGAAGNKVPVVNAGADVTVTLPTSFYQTSATASDPDGTIAKYAWTKTSGPASFTFSNAAVLNPLITGLVAGTYVFRLTVTDNSGATAFNEITVTVVNNASQGTTTKTINVNIYGGTNPYQDSHWNNFNAVTAVVPSVNIASGKFNYADGTASNISAVLERSQAVADNGVTYGGGMAPAEVLRYTSYSSSDRTLTLSGLTIGKTYSIDLYSSRSTPNNPTKFTIGGQSITVATYNNFTNKATFSNLLPDANGQIVVYVLRTASFSYINGFTLTENDGTTSNGLVQALSEVDVTTAETESEAVKIYPNPATDQFTVRLNTTARGNLDIRLLSMSGQVIDQFHAVKDQDVVTKTCYLKSIPRGSYVVEIKVGDNWRRVKTIIKL